MKQIFRLFLVNILLISISVSGQDFFINEGKHKFNMNFMDIGNLIVVPLSINGSVPLNFVIDTGSQYTIITNLEAINYFRLNKGKQISIAGLGNDGKKLQAYLSKNNSLQLGQAVSNSTDIVLLFEQDFDLSTRFGVPIYGIIGYDILKDFVIEVNYTRKKLYFYEPPFFAKRKQKKLEKFDEIPLIIQSGKPFVLLNSEINDKEIPLKLLIDSGSWDAIWLFEDQRKGIHTPVKNIDDYLGYGLNGEIHGRKSRINRLEFGSSILHQPTTSFPDSLSVSNIKRNDRNGTLGSEIMRRFTTIYNFSDKKIYIKQNSHINDEFHYNMAGLELYQPFPNLPYLEVIYVRKNSPAARAGIKKGDAIRYINGKKVGVFQTNIFDEKLSATKVDIIQVSGKKVETISMPEILNLFKRNEGDKIHLIYTRGNNLTEHSTDFKLEKSI